MNSSRIISAGHRVTVPTINSSYRMRIVRPRECGSNLLKWGRNHRFKDLLPKISKNYFRALWVRLEIWPQSPQAPHRTVRIMYIMLN